MIQLSLCLAVIGRSNTEKLQQAYIETINTTGKIHEQLEELLLDLVQEKYTKHIEKFCNDFMILSELKVAEDMVEELRQLRQFTNTTH